MAEIIQIDLRLKTGDVKDAGTDGDIYLGLCGREFYVDRGNVDDFEQTLKLHTKWVLNRTSQMAVKMTRVTHSLIPTIYQQAQIE